MPAAPELAAVFRQPFAEQVAFFRGKLGNLAPTAKWDDLWKSQHDRAFMVAGAAKADLLADLAEAVDKAIAEGETLQDFRKRFAEIVDRRGWHGWTGEATRAGRAWRTRIIYQTNLSTSYAAGRLAQLKEAGFPLWVYRHSRAEHPRLQHLAWDGLTLPADHPFWQTHYPPSGWGCRCRVVGADGPKSAARLGGKPGYTEPPEGWDAIDPKTREMVGIDKGWGYMPGASVLCTDAHAAGGGRRCADMALVDALLEKVAGKPALIGAQMVDAWPDHVFALLASRFGEIADAMITHRRPQGRRHFVGAMKATWVAQAISAGATLKTAELTVRDQDITHAMRPAKARDGKTVDPQWYRALPLHLRAPDAVLLRMQRKQEMLLVYDGGADKAKIVVLLDYGGDGLNVVRTASRMIELDTLRAMVGRGEAAVLEGKL